MADSRLNMDSQIEAFENLSVPRALAKFIIPSVISQMAMLILNLTDAFFVGRTGDTSQISAMTITFPIAMMIACCASVFGAGGNAGAASCLGAGDPDRARKFSVFSVYTAIAVVTIFSLVLLCVRTPLLILLGADESSLGYCEGYLLWVFHVACVPLAFTQVMSQLFVAEGETRVSSIAVTGAGLLNAVLDPVFIFVLHQGVVGAAIATCIANYCSAGFLLTVYMKKRKTSILSLDIRQYSPRDGVCRQVLAVGIPSGLTLLLMNCCDFVRNFLLKQYGGQIELAAWGTVQKLGNAFMQIGMGVSVGIRPLVAYNYTAGSIRRTRSIIRGAALLAGCYTFLCFIVMLTHPEPLVRLFLPVDGAAEVAASFLRVWSFSIFGVVILELMNSIFQAMGRWQLTLAGVIISKLGLMIPVMLILARIRGVMGVVATQPLTESFMAAVMVIIYLAGLGKMEERSPKAKYRK